MPNYDYVCETCGHEWELFQSMNDSPAKSCPKCKKRKARRQIGLGAGIIFKGSGFYETDYKRSAETKKKEAQAESSGDSGSSKSSDSGDKKSESKDSSSSTTTKKDSETKSD